MINQIAFDGGLNVDKNLKVDPDFSELRLKFEDKVKKSIDNAIDLGDGFK